MKKVSLLEKLRRFFDKKLKRQEAKIKKLKELLKKLKVEEVALRTKLKKDKNKPRRAHFERALKVIHEQRKKGIELHRSLRK